MTAPSTGSVSALEEHIGYWLRLVSGHVSVNFARALELQQVSIAEWVALNQLFHQREITSGELATFMGITPGAVSKVVDKLKDKGWVISQTKSADRRIQSLSLTPEGTQVVPKLSTIADKNDHFYFACLTAQERRQLTNVLRKLVHIHQWNDVPVE